MNIILIGQGKPIVLDTLKWNSEVNAICFLTYFHQRVLLETDHQNVLESPIIEQGRKFYMTFLYHQ